MMILLFPLYYMAKMSFSLPFYNEFRFEGIYLISRLSEFKIHIAKFNDWRLAENLGAIRLATPNLRI